MFRQLTGALQYLIITRPHIAFTVNKLCQTMHKPYNIHFQQLKWLLRYIKGTSNYDIKITLSNLTLTGFSDSDWASDNNDRKSTTSYCILLGYTPISWASKKQHVVARSSIEAEYRALTTTSFEILWLQNMLGKLGIHCTTTTTLYCDNIFVISLVHNPVTHAKTKYIEVDCHYIRECIKTN